MQKNSIFQNPENVSKSVQISSEVIFSELFLTSATWRSKLVEIRKKIEKIEFLKVSKTFLKVSKQVLNLFWGIFLERNIAQCTLEGRNMEKRQKNGKTFIFFQNAQKRSQMQSNMFGTCFELFLPVKNFAQCTLGGREVEKVQKTGKLSIFKMPKYVPKSVQTCFQHASRYFFR